MYICKYGMHYFPCRLTLLWYAIEIAICDRVDKLNV